MEDEEHVSGRLLAVILVSIAVIFVLGAISLNYLAGKYL